MYKPNIPLTKLTQEACFFVHGMPYYVRITRMADPPQTGRGHHADLAFSRMAMYSASVMVPSLSVSAAANMSEI